MPRTWCGPSCGEQYWGDFYSDPPDCWDPCDCTGNYTGGGYPGGGYPDGGCPTCGNGYGNSRAFEDVDSVVSRSNRTNNASKTAVKPHKAVR